MKKVWAYFRGPQDIPVMTELLGLPEAELLAKYEAADAEGLICVFEAEVTAEQYAAIQRWKNSH